MREKLYFIKIRVFQKLVLRHLRWFMLMYMVFSWLGSYCWGNPTLEAFARSLVSVGSFQDNQCLMNHSCFVVSIEWNYWSCAGEAVSLLMFWPRLPWHQRKEEAWRFVIAFRSWVLQTGSKLSLTIFAASISDATVVNSFLSVRSFVRLGRSMEGHS